MSEKLTQQEILWQDLYGDLPEDPNELIELAKSIKRVDWDLYEKEKERLLNMEWKTIKISLPLIPKSCPRPRLSPINHTFYVKGAAENKKIIKHFIRDSEIVHTSVRFFVDAYFPTPKSQLKGYEIILAEEGLIRPSITKDWDNIGKTYSDMVQGFLLINDNIIVDGKVRKFYSLRPHVDITIEYQVEYDSIYNQRRIESSKSYISLLDKNKEIPMRTKGKKKKK